VTGIGVFVVAYLVCQFAVGVYFFRRVRSTQQYIVARGSLNAGTLGGTLAATQLSSATALGDVAWTSFYGVAYYVLVWPFLWLGYWIGARWVAGKMWAFGERAGGLTIPHLLAARYDSQKLVRPVAGLVLIFAFLFSFGVQFQAAGIVLNKLFGLSYTPAVLIAAAVFLAYTYLGGLLSIAYNDSLQICLFVVAYLVAAVFVVRYSGGLGHITTVIRHTDPSLLSLFGSKGLPFGTILGIGIATTLLFISYPIDTMKFYSAKDPKSLFNGIGVAFVLQALVAIAVIALGIAGRVLHPTWSLDQFDALMPTYALKVVPPVVGALVMAIILGAVMAVSSSILLTLGAAVSQDIYAPLFRPHATDRERLLMTRLGVTIIAVAGTALSFAHLGPIATVVNNVLQVLAASFPVAMLGGMVSRRPNRLGALLSMVGGAIGVIIWVRLGNPHGLAPVFLGMALSIIGMVVGIAMGRPVRPAVVDPFFTASAEGDDPAPFHAALD
jgi:sodium/proline symporter